MGVPNLFRSIIKKYPECYTSINNDTVEHLYFDFNCLIHHCVHNVSYDDESSQRDIEEAIIIKVISYTKLSLSVKSSQLGRSIGLK